ncbi:metal ABC transporter solute-binding protein, Zn/Mn family [Cellulomonas edaphi]|uniref:Zinc ABC transporter substrate-binding protein n=1 Tax=Cellulomonas edaphi TaxID=3053468 RepID=A0ABT7S9Y3_9CELL|nr:zinc ABC transporter substrate-binding protein [Cellulomons edaphi]MDM7831847.1 zinc ABC transporter substrate-binding protein [Cellulomons edaphi]
MTKPNARSASLAVTAALAALALAGCSSAASTPQSSDGAVRVVASTNVYGDIAEQVGGDLVQVTSIVDDPSADPHSYEASAQTQLALSKAALVVENGGGYDDFVDTMLDAVDNDPAVVNAVDVSGKAAAAGDELNEHVWYDFPTVTKVADAIATSLSAIDAENAATYDANARAFADQVDGLVAATGEVEADHAGAGVAITEPVPLYLLENAGLVNKTPAEFSEAIEDETDVPPAALRDTLDLFTSGAVSALVYNEQTTGPQTAAVLAAAKDAGVPVVPVTETLPEGTDYVSWMTANLAALRTALAS